MLCVSFPSPISPIPREATSSRLLCLMVSFIPLANAVPSVVEPSPHSTITPTFPSIMNMSLLLRTAALQSSRRVALLLPHFCRISTRPLWIRPFHEMQAHTESSTTSEEPMSKWAYSIWGVILGANALAIWCEMQMTCEQSLLQGLATAQVPEKQQQQEETTTNQAVGAETNLPSWKSPRQPLRKLQIRIQWS